MKYIVFSACLILGISTGYIAPLTMSLPDQSAVAYRETLPLHCNEGDSRIILSEQLREDFLCIRKDQWMKTLSYSIVDK